MNVELSKRYLVFGDGTYIDFVNDVFFSPEASKPTLLDGKIPLECLKLIINSSEPVTSEAIYETIWKESVSDTLSDYKHYVNAAITAARNQLKKAVPSLDGTKVIFNHKGKYSFVLPEGAYFSDTNKEYESEIDETYVPRIEAMINFRYLEENTNGIPITVDIYNDLDHLVRDISLLMMHPRTARIFLKDRVAYIPAKERFSYFLGYIKGNNVNLISDQKLELTKVIEESNFDIRIEDEKGILILCNAQEAADEQSLSKGNSEATDGNEKMLLDDFAQAAVNLSRAGNNDDARIMREFVLQERKKVYDADSDEVLIAEANLATTYDRIGMYAEALKLRQHVFDVRTKRLPPDHPKLLKARANLLATLRNIDSLKTREK